MSEPNASSCGRSGRNRHNQSRAKDNPTSSQSTPKKRLDSWKEIAAFLERDERTVRRWEIERGMPVHRVPGGRGSVFAFTGELTGWLGGASVTETANRLDSADVAVSPHPEGAPSEVAVVASIPFPASTNLPSLLSVSRWRSALWSLPVVFLTGLLLFVFYRHRDARFQSLAGPPRNTHVRDLQSVADSVAVLPFANEPASSGTDYLADGITESLIGNLAHMPQLKVRSRDSVFGLKGHNIDANVAGTQLGVSVVVTGRVTVHGDDIVVSTKLTRVGDNAEIWANRYSGSTANLLKIQQQVAGDIAQKLPFALGSGYREQIMRQSTQDPDAYALYLRGRYAWNKRTMPELETAISYFNQAIARDPNYALAYSGLADAYSVMPNFGGNPAEDFAKSNAAARKAMQLDPTLARPHAVLGMNETEYEWDFAGGEAEFKNAIALDPNDATAHQWYAEKLSQLGRRDEALAEIHRAGELDPLSPVITRVLAGTLVDAGHYDEGIAICRQLAQENPTFAIAHDCLAFPYWHKKMYAQAIEEWKTYGRLTGNPEAVKYAAALEQGFRSGGWPGALSEAIAFRQSKRKTGYSSPFEIGLLYADLGDKEKAFEWLDIAFREHDRFLPGLNGYPEFDSIRSDPRFAALVAKVGLPEAAR